jgi:ATP adenylyltransferase
MIEGMALWRRVDEITRREQGQTLQGVPTTCEIFVEDGIPYQLRVLQGVHPKRRAKKEQQKSGRNPFLPPEPDLFVGNLSQTHAAVLNKFNVFGGHLLVITREFVPQEGLLNRDDFDALAIAMAGIDGLGFFNAGPRAGASQAHRHLQVAPLPLTPSTEEMFTPIDAVIESGRGLPYPHRLQSLEGRRLLRSDASVLFEVYKSLMADLGLATGDHPYNLLLTRRWMMVIPRSRDRVEGISINALGFAGSLLVRDQRRLDRIKDLGPGAVLRGVTTGRP